MYPYLGSERQRGQYPRQVQTHPIYNGGATGPVTFAQSVSLPGDRVRRILKLEGSLSALHGPEIATAKREPYVDSCVC
jgi:hypothetical protein